MRCLYFIFIIAFFFSGCESNILNPFSDRNSENVTYQIQKESFVKFTIENSYNTVVATLVDTQKPAGSYHIIFDTIDIPEGIYFLKLTARGVYDNFYIEETIIRVFIK